MIQASRDPLRRTPARPGFLPRLVLRPLPAPLGAADPRRAEGQALATGPAQGLPAYG